MNTRALVVGGAALGAAALLAHRKRELPPCTSTVQAAANATLRGAGAYNKMTCNPDIPIPESSSGGIGGAIKDFTTGLFGGAAGVFGSKALDGAQEGAASLGKTLVLVVGVGIVALIAVEVIKR